MGVCVNNKSRRRKEKKTKFFWGDWTDLTSQSYFFLLKKHFARDAGSGIPSELLDSTYGFVCIQQTHFFCCVLCLAPPFGLTLTKFLWLSGDLKKKTWIKIIYIHVLFYSLFYPLVPPWFSYGHGGGSVERPLDRGEKKESRRKSNGTWRPARPRDGRRVLRVCRRIIPDRI